VAIYSTEAFSVIKQRRFLKCKGLLVQTFYCILIFINRANSIG